MAAGNRGWKPSTDPPRDLKHPDKREQPVKRAEYRDRDGSLFGVHVRFETRDEAGNGTQAEGKPDKVYCWYRDGKWSLDGISPRNAPLYASDRVADTGPVFVCEGDTATDALLDLGLAAVGTAGTTVPCPRSLELLRERKVIVWPDNDQAGRSHSKAMVEALQPIAAEVGLLDPGPLNLPPKGDAVQWEARKGDQAPPETLLAELLPHVAWLAPTLHQTHERAQPIQLADLCRLELPPGQPLLGDFLHEREVGMVWGKRGCGKTMFCVSLALAVASGRSFLGWEGRAAAPVLYVDGEMDTYELRSRFALLSHTLGLGGLEDSSLPLWVLSKPYAQLKHGVVIGDLSTDEGQGFIDDRAAAARVIFLDNLSSLVHGDDSDPKAWVPVQDWLNRLRAAGKTVVFVHHSRKGDEDQRGTSRREDTLDWSIHLSPPKTYRPEVGCSFVTRFTKTRKFLGTAAASMKASLMAGDDGQAEWAFEAAAKSTRRQEVVKLYLDGVPQSEIAAEVGIDKSGVTRHLQKAREKREIPEDDRKKR